jgi:cyclase
MSLTRRIIACLDVAAGCVVKGRAFLGLREVGDPVALATVYERDGADELVFLDISATHEERRAMLDIVSATADDLFIPLTIGGGIRTVEDVAAALRAGADKVSINSAAVARPALLTECAGRFGSQATVASIDAKRMSADRFEVFVRGGQQPTGLDAVDWACECERRGAGEILLTSIDRDGARTGYDLELTRAVADAVAVPVIASGGAGSSAHVADVLAGTSADAALIAGILHDGTTTVANIKACAAERHLPIRLAVE